MKVKQLKELLNQFSEDMDVFWNIDDEAYQPIVFLGRVETKESKGVLYKERSYDDKDANTWECVFISGEL